MSCDGGRFATNSRSDMGGGLQQLQLSRATSCNKCPNGFYSKSAAISCQACIPGRSSGDGSTNCSLCGVGKYSLFAAPLCSDCAPGTYSNIRGQVTCNQCDGNSQSIPGSCVCDRCDKGYYYFNGACATCPHGTNCTSEDVTLEYLPIKKSYWRASSQSTKIRKCTLKGACNGGLNFSSFGDGYCAEGYSGE